MLWFERRQVSIQKLLVLEQYLRWILPRQDAHQEYVDDSITLITATDLGTMHDES